MGNRKKKILIIIPIVLLLVMCITCGIYFAIYYHCVDDYALDNTDLVAITENDDYYFFDGPGDNSAFIFYPGAKVESKSYAALMKEIATLGVDCYLVKMPLNFALLGVNKADDIIDSNNYNNWYLGGHSLGGVITSHYAVKNDSKIKGLVFLAAWSDKDLSSTSLKTLSIYGSNDGVLNIDKLNKNSSNLPKASETYIIEGGNHSQFGCYGKQNGDNEASISSKEQRIITVNKIVNFILY